jgi:arginase
MGRGPGALIAAGLAATLETAGFEVESVVIQLPDGFLTEGNALVELQRAGVAAVSDALARGARPVLLSGNCGPAALSAAAALGAETTGVIWFDAHGDFNTPDTSPSGFFDGMGLAVLVGDCWPELAKRLAAFAPVPSQDIVQVGVRDCDAGEEIRLDQSGIRRIPSTELRQLERAVTDLSQRVTRVYVHVDVDVLDISEGRANTFACAGGLSLDELLGALEIIGRLLPIAAGSITSYDPEADVDGRIGRAIPRIVELLAR